MFISMLAADKVSGRVKISDEFSKTLWGLKFNSPLFNAAGMFKYGEGYYTVAMQGAGAYLAGTTTDSPRKGNKFSFISHPAVSFPKSAMAVNWMGLPNEGHEEVARRLSHIDKIEGCPVGASLSASPEQSGFEALQGVVKGFELYTKANVDFLELNESCPNVAHEHSEDTINGIDKSLVDRLEYLSQHFLSKRDRFVPVIVKFSNDTAPEIVPAIVDMLITLGYDGVNFGNTSTDYMALKKDVSENELKLFEFFTGNIGGGVSGRALKTRSYALSSLAVESIKKINPQNEFNVIRTGGIENFDDVLLSEKSGIALNQWFTGYFDAFARSGHNVYADFFDNHI
jgi:dihydroorotate dehydrogenase